MTSQSSFERDRVIARERYPEEMERLETLRAGFGYDFTAALHHACQQGHLVRWVNGTHILSYDPGVSPVGLLVRCDSVQQKITDIGMVGPLNCSPFVEVRYERQASEQAEAQPSPRADRGEQSARAQVRPGYFEPDAYWGSGNYYGDPPTPPPGAIPLSRDAANSIADSWKRAPGAIG